MKKETEVIIDNDSFLYKRESASKKNSKSPDSYLEFVDFYNSFINHRRKQFKPIEGEFIF